MTKALVKLKRDPEAEGRQQDLERFTAFRLEHDLPFERRHVPGWWENLPDLENKYARNETKAEAAKAALPPARPRAAPTYVTRKELDQTLEAIGVAMRHFVDPYIKRIEELEARPSMQHRGVWRGDVQYSAGDVVSHGGSGWVAKAVNKAAKPGDTRLWTLFVKKGRDAK